MNKAWIGAAAAVAATALIGGCGMMHGDHDHDRHMASGGGPGRLTLTGANEVPAVSSGASGTSTIRVGADCSVTGSVTVTGMTGTAAHIHQGAPGSNGGVIVPFTKTGENTFAPAPGAKLNEAQCEAYKRGETYVNVHSAAHPGGEVRAQLKP